ncbi:MAG: ATP-binding protein [Bacteroidetes bacterium]|nr:MAG: ATP-binding protein [Bacteroidota bacterium]
MTKSNPFKFGSVVDEPFFTDRNNELQKVKNVLQSPNHLILISPRRYGKTSLILKAVKALHRSYLFIDLQLVTDTADLARQLLKHIYRLFPFEKVKQYIKHFRVIPSLNINPLTNEIDISLQPAFSADFLLEDVLNTIEKLGTPDKRIIVIIDEFQDINHIEKGLDKKFRAIVQYHKNVNYAFLGSIESMMREIFEKKKSPFYHFGQIMPLNKIPEDDLLLYLNERLTEVCSDKEAGLQILNITKAHPYYTQQLAFTVWDICRADKKISNPVKCATDYLIQIHDIDYERLWNNQTQTDKKVLIALANNESNLLTGTVLNNYGIPAASTAYSSLKKLMNKGLVLKSDTGYQLDDPFFAGWITMKRNSIFQ